MTEDDNTKDLTEDLSKDLTDSEKLDWLMETLQRFMARDTNPLPPNYDARFAALEHSLAEFRAETNARLDALEKVARLTNHKLDELNANAFDTRAAQRELAARVTQLESRPS